MHKVAWDQTREFSNNSWAWNSLGVRTSWGQLRGPLGGIVSLFWATLRSHVRPTCKAVSYESFSNTAQVTLGLSSRAGRVPSCAGLFWGPLAITTVPAQVIKITTPTKTKGGPLIFPAGPLMWTLICLKGVDP